MTQQNLNLEPPCNPDTCTIAMCGCRWLNSGSPWVEQNAVAYRLIVNGNAFTCTCGCDQFVRRDEAEKHFYWCMRCNNGFRGTV